MNSHTSSSAASDVSNYFIVGGFEAEYTHIQIRLVFLIFWLRIYIYRHIRTQKMAVYVRRELQLWWHFASCGAPSRRLNCSRSTVSPFYCQLKVWCYASRSIECNCTWQRCDAMGRSGIRMLRSSELQSAGGGRCEECQQWSDNVHSSYCYRT